MSTMDEKIDNLENELNDAHSKHGSKEPFTAENIKTAGENIDSATGGTEQSKASTWLGLLSRRSSGILGLHQEIKSLKRGTLFNKGFSIVGSAGGFAFMVISMLGITLNFSLTTVIIYILGLAVGLYIENVAINSEKAFIPKELEEEHSPFDKYDKTWFFGAKIYAIGMHISFAMSIATVIAMVNMSNIEDNPTIQAMNKQIDRLSKVGTSSVSKEDAIKNLNEDIASLRADSKSLLAEKEGYIPNSKSKYERKAKSAQDSIDKIVAQIDANKKEIAKKSAKRTSLQNSDPNIILEDKISKINEKIDKERAKLKKEALATAKENSGIGVTIMIALLLILVEIYGSYSSIKAKTKVQQMVGPEIAYGDRVVESLHSRDIALNERDIALKAQKVKSSTKIAFAQNKMTQYEIDMAMETQRYRQITRIQEHRMNNAKNKLESMETEIMVETFEGMAEGIKVALSTKNRVLESF